MRFIVPLWEPAFEGPSFPGRPGAIGVMMRRSQFQNDPINIVAQKPFLSSPQTTCGELRGLFSKFSIGLGTWRPLTGPLTYGPEMGHKCQQAITDQATFLLIFPSVGGPFVAHLLGEERPRNLGASAAA